MDELKPCPFCGTVPKLVEMGDIIGIECGGDCDKTGLCVAFAPHKRDTAIAAWNRRAALAPAQPIQEPVAYVYEHYKYPQDYERTVSFEQTAHVYDFVCRPLVYAAPSPTKEQTPASSVEIVEEKP